MFLCVKYDYKYDWPILVFFLIILVSIFLNSYLYSIVNLNNDTIKLFLNFAIISILFIGLVFAFKFIKKEDIEHIKNILNPKNIISSLKEQIL